jgi:hypothetical protein
MNTQSRLSVLTKTASLAVAVTLLGAAADSVFAASGPQYRSLRGLSMGNAFVAVVDAKEALYFNPAGLNLINTLGNASARPGLAGYPRKRLNARSNMFGVALPVGDMNDFYGFFKDHKKSFSNSDSLRADGTLFDDLAPFDRRPVEIGILHGFEFAMHNFGAAYWADARIAPYADVGVLLPQAGIETIELDAVIQVAGARGFLNNRLAAGAGYRIANRQTVKNFSLAASEFAEDGGQAVIDRVQDTINEKFENLTDITSYGHGIDLGALWQQTSWLRFGAALQNMGMYLNDELVTPELTVGLAITPPIASTGGMFARKVNFALDFEDLLNDERNYRLYSKINFGAEVEQQFWWLASVRLSGGFKGGYWAAGTGVSLLTALHLEAATWAEEAGLYTGHIEERFYAVRLGVGL